MTLPHPFTLFKTSACSFALLGAATAALRADTVPVPNGSFESQSGVGQPFGVNINIDSWQKAPRPGYFDEMAFGFQWVQTMGVFVDTNPYLNHTGTQAGYILPFPGAAIFQDYSTVDFDDAAPTHDFNAVFQIGKAYHLTLGVFGKSIADGSLLQVSLYYRDGGGLPVTVGTPATIAYHAADFPTTPPLSLVDFTAEVPTVQAGDAWAGQNLGISIAALSGTGSGNWDFDNVRLTETPEPSALGLLALGCGGLLRRRRGA